MAMDQIPVAHTENGHKISIQIVMQKTKDKTKLNYFFPISPCSPILVCCIGILQFLYIGYLRSMDRCVTRIGTAPALGCCLRQAASSPKHE